MKKPLNISSSQSGAVCSLCQDTLLRHINQSRMFWYCPSCRQEMVCEEQPDQARTPIANHRCQPTQHRQLANVTDHSLQVSFEPVSNY